MFNTLEESRNAYMLSGKLSRQGYDWWWHSFTAYHAKTGEEKSFFIEYFLCNPAYGKEKPVFGQLPENKSAGKKPSYLCVKAGCWGEDACQIHRFFGWKESKVRKGTPFQIKAKDCYASETRLRGTVSVTKKEAREHPEYMCDAGRMKWNLKVEKKTAFHVGYGASRLFRWLNAFEMYWHAQGMKTRYSGTVIYNGETYLVSPESCYGYADKNWGSGFTSPWVWLSSNHLTSIITGEEQKNSVFDIGGGCPRVFGYPLKRKLLGAFWYEGVPYEYNFSKFWTGTKTKFKCHETKEELIWKIRQENYNSIMETEIHCKKSEMLWIQYEAPDGSKRHNRLWNGGTGSGEIWLYRKKGNRKILIDYLLAQNVGCEYGEYDRE